MKDYNPTKTRKVLMVFNDVIAGTEANKNPIVTKLFLREKKSTFHLFLYHKKTGKLFTFHFQSA